MDISGGVRPRTGKPSFQPSLGSGATQKRQIQPANDVRQYIVIYNLIMIHLPTDSGKMKEAAEASWEGFKPGRPYVTCLTSARGLSCMTRQGIEARWNNNIFLESND